MIEPTVALATAMRAVLITTPAVTALVPIDHIRSGSTRPDKTPAIIMSDGTTHFAGEGYTAQRAAWVFMDIHVWTLDAGQEAAKTIAFAVRNALDQPLPADGFAIDDFKITRAVFPRDPDPKFGHGVVSVEAFIRWTV